VFSPSSFRIWGHILSSFICFELVFVQDETLRSSFSLLHVDIQIPQHNLLKRLSFLQYIFLAPSLSISWLKMHGFIPGSSILCHWLMCRFLC
jgi:hypothetical protein